MTKSLKTLLLILTMSTTAPVYCNNETEILPSDKKSKVYISPGSRKAAHIIALIYAGIAIPAGFVSLIAAANRTPEIATPTALMSIFFGGSAIWAELKAYFDYYEIEIPQDIALTLNVIHHTSSKNK